MPGNQMMAMTTHDSAGMPWRKGQHRREVALDRRRAADQEGQQGSEHERPQQTAEDAGRSQQHLGEKRCVEQYFHCSRQDGRDRRDEIARKEQRCDLPEDEQHEHACGPPRRLPPTPVAAYFERGLPCLCRPRDSRRAHAVGFRGCSSAAPKSVETAVGSPLSRGRRGARSSSEFPFIESACRRSSRPTAWW